jgi:osmoprotectant transport system permease protein
MQAHDVEHHEPGGTKRAPMGAAPSVWVARAFGALAALVVLAGLIWFATSLPDPRAGMESWWEFMTERARDQIVERTVEHGTLVLRAVLIATVLAVSLGILAHRWRVLRAPLLGLASVFLTIPSLALFTLFIPLVGLGATPALIALVMYALLPIMRNTVAGLESVDPAVVESARGVGLSKRQTLLRVELPLAWPVISTGIRVSLLLATGIAAIATLVGGGGLGEFIKQGLPRYPLGVSVEQIWTGTVLTMVLALVFDAVFGIIRFFTTPRGIRN